MATKTISVTEEAYNILKTKKEATESFSEVIVKLSGKKKLSSFFGALSEESVSTLENEINEMRKVHRKAHSKRIAK